MIFLFQVEIVCKDGLMYGCDRVATILSLCHGHMVSEVPGFIGASQWTVTNGLHGLFITVTKHDIRIVVGKRS